MTKLDKPLKRELKLGRDPFVPTVNPGGFKLTKKGCRNGIEIGWHEIGWKSLDGVARPLRATAASPA